MALSQRKFFNRIDLISIAVILIIAVSIYVYQMTYSREEAVMAEVVYDGQVVKTVELNKDSVFTVEGIPQVEFEVNDNAIRFKSSDCLDQVCVHSGYLKTQAHFAACLPNRLVLRVLGETSEDEPDLIA